VTTGAKFFWALLAFALAVSCGANRLPPGTPPPEYETREPPPWTGDVPAAVSAAPIPSDPAPVVGEAAAAPVPTEQPKTEPAPPDAGAGPSPDASVR
jgi:hypothetical protein